MPRFAEVLASLPGARDLLSDVVWDAPFGVYLDHPVAGCVYANRELLRQFGVSWEHFRGFQWARRVHEADAEALRDAIARFEERCDTIDVTYRVHRDDGGLGWVHARVTALTSDSGERIGSVGVTEDVTAQRDARDRTLEKQKLEAVGRLSARVAHDFNNILCAILGSTALARGAEDAEAVNENLRAIEDAVEHASSITSQLVTLAGKNRGSGPCELDAELRQLEPLLSRSLGEGIALTMDLNAGPHWVALSRSELAQILINLALNGRDAMKGRGPLEVRTRFREGDVVLSVRDEGIGMSVETQRRAFEPFYTTKSEGRGSGIGLSTVQTLVRGAGGEVRAESAVGRGTQFEVRLPATARSERQRERERDDELEHAADGELEHGVRVLLVDDNDALRQSLAYALALAGHDVVTACGVSQALQTFRSSAVDLVVSDVMLPDGNGIELVRTLRAERPNLPVVFMSGYVGDETAGMPRDLPLTVALDKPFHAWRLGEAVAKVLREAARNHPAAARR